MKRFWKGGAHCGVGGVLVMGWVIRLVGEGDRVVIGVGRGLAREGLKDTPRVLESKIVFLPRLGKRWASKMGRLLECVAY